jgi:hypothetical protein
MRPNEKPATRGRNGLSDDLLGGCDLRKDTLSAPAEQARACETISRQRASEALQHAGIIGRQERALAAFYGRRARSFMEAAQHG